MDGGVFKFKLENWKFKKEWLSLKIKVRKGYWLIICRVMCLVFKLRRVILV